MKRRKAKLFRSLHDAGGFIELPFFSTIGVPELRNKKWLNYNLTCGTIIIRKSKVARNFVSFFYNNLNGKFALRKYNIQRILPMV
jgi:hypothetical protein